MARVGQGHTILCGSREGTHSLPGVKVRLLGLTVLSDTMMTTHFMDPVAVGRHRCETGI